MIADLRLLFESELVDGEVPIIDLGNLTLRHFTKLSLPITKKYMIYTQVSHIISKLFITLFLQTFRKLIQLE